MLTPVRTAQFERDVRRARARGKDLSKLPALLESLIRQEPLAARHRDHPLRGSSRLNPAGRVQLRQAGVRYMVGLPDLDEARHRRVPGSVDDGHGGVEARVNVESKVR